MPDQKNFCLQTALACRYASKHGFCTEMRCITILEEINGALREDAREKAGGQRRAEIKNCTELTPAQDQAFLRGMGWK